ncbi:MAG: 2-oxoacid:acceptor oxidoreductase family protein [Thermoplasmata archaeon]
MKKLEIFLSGQGGQGVLDLGNFLAYHWMLDGYHVVYTPSYGPETRGGKVRCYVIISKNNIDSPMIINPDILVVMNGPSMDFVPLLKEKGTLIYNTSIINREIGRNDINVVPIPSTDMADNLKSILPKEIGEMYNDTKVAQNAIVYGAMISIFKMKESNIDPVLNHFYTGTKNKYMVLNKFAVEEGIKYAKEKNILPVNIPF